MPTPASDELRLVQSMARSKFFRWQQTYLMARLDELVNDETDNPTALAMNKGAMREVRRLMKAPALVAAYLAGQREREAGEPVTGTVPTPHGDAMPFWAQPGDLPTE